VNISDGSSRAERERRAGLLAAALEASTDAIYITDAGGRIEYVNPSFERLTGYRSADVIGRSASLLSPGSHHTDVFARLWQAVRAGESFSGEVLQRRADGSLYTVDLVITSMQEHDEAPLRYVAVCRDVSERKRMERVLEDLAYYDPLTGLANHRLLEERSKQILALTRRHGSVTALLHVDIDGMKSINEQYGRAIGDDVLRAVADRLRLALRESDTLARTGSDEFLVLLSEVLDGESAARVARRLHDSIVEPLLVRGRAIDVHARAGVALYPQDAGTFDELLECAELAMHRARHAGTSFEFFERAQSAANHDRMLLEDELRRASEHEQFELHYQPIMGPEGHVVGAEAMTRAGPVIGVEALARWPHLHRGMVPPTEFIPVAERTGRILTLDRWALATAARQAAAWLDNGWDGWISVNLSARTLHDPTLIEYISRLLAANRLAPGRLAVEITESTAMRDPGFTARVLDALREIGVLVAVDDFGIGHTSLAYLKLFPVDLLKLDTSFVRGVGEGGRDEQLVDVIITLAHRIGAKVVAEGVETEEQMKWLTAAGCDYVQGFLLGMPAPPESLPRPTGRPQPLE
jgi:diguanylate cyclase (GGDEF)-like protein/PAS domain S-box-containing protein